MTRQILSTLAVITVWASMAVPATAHPHVWVTVKSTLLYDKSQRIIGVRHRWTFDEFYSAFAAQGLDKNGDGKFDRKELHALAEENVVSLKEFDYFTFMKAGTNDVAIEPPKDYWLDHEDGVLVLNFTLPLSKSVDARKVASSLSIYDPTYFVAFSFAETNPVQLASAAPKNCSVGLQRRKNEQVETASLTESFFEGLDANSGFGSKFAQTVSINCDG